ncbi:MULTISPECIES: hypothetical protein [Paenibacillus]|uniref:hypothetical protein n=1 Tax=Paenibacillus TaxID=44249 RepID=UPI001FEAD98E|nr:hypothetical protein [Paenibacillus anaericanus]
MAKQVQIVEEKVGLIAQAPGTSRLRGNSRGSKGVLSEGTRVTATGRGVKTIWQYRPSNSHRNKQATGTGQIRRTDTQGWKFYAA